MTVCSFSTQFSRSSLGACYWTVFTVCFSSYPQSLRSRVTPHNFTAVFVCNRGCCWIRANKAACDAWRRAGNKGRHLSCVTFVRLWSKKSYRMYAKLLVTQLADPTHLRHFHLEIMKSLNPVISHFPQMENIIPLYPAI